MPSENNRRGRPEPQDPGFEAVGGPTPARPAPRPARPLSPPRTGAPTPARPVPKKIAEDPGFEVVDAAPPPKKPKVRVVNDDDDTEEAPRSKARTHADRDYDEDDAPRKKRRRFEEDDEDDRPRKKKKKRKKGGIEISDGANNVMLDWGGPIFLMVLGLAMGIAGSVGMAMKPDYGISPVLSAALFVIGNLIWIPVEIVALFIIGKLFGIEYGDITSAVRNLAAMAFLVGGLIAVLDWVGISWFIANPIIFMVGVGLFIALFKLDVWEAIVTMIGLNVLSLAFNILLFVIVIAMFLAAAKHGGGGYEDDYDGGPGINEKFDPDDFDDGGDEWDPDAPRAPVNPRGKAKGPTSKAKGPGMGGNPKGNSRPRSPFPDDDG